MRTNKTIILIIIVVGIIFFFCACNYLSPSELNTTSPNKTYRVHLQELEERRLVLFSIEKQKRTFIKDEIFSSGESGKFIDFDLRYDWTAENILRFGYFDSSVKPDEISVINQTDKVIKYLKADAFNNFLLFELQPQATTRLFAYPQNDKNADISWIGGFVKYDDGREILNWGMNFRIRGKYVSPAHYCVFIKENAVIVQSKDFEGFNDESELPEAKNPLCQ